jgi:hypothetical protein
MITLFPSQGDFCVTAKSVIVEGTEMLYGIAEHKELIHRLGIPRLKHLREEPEAEMRYEPRTSKN